MAILIGEYQTISQGSYPSYYDWVNIDNAVDSTSETYAVATVPAVSGSTLYTEDGYAENHTIDTTRVDYIVKVEVGIKAYASIDNDEYKFTVLGGYIPSYGSAGSYQYIKTSIDTYWLDITSDYDMPGYGQWTWEDIKNLAVYFRTHSLYTDPSPQQLITYVDQIYIRVTTSNNPVVFYGLECWDSTGNQTLTVTDRITRVIFKKEVASLDSGHEDFPIPSGGLNRVFGYSYSLDGLNGGMAHNVSVTQVDSNTLRCTWTENSSFLSGPDIYLIPSAPSLIIVLGW